MSTKQDPTLIRKVPLLPLRDITVFPHMVVPLFVGRGKSILALEQAMTAERDVLLVAQRSPRTNDPALKDVFGIATLGTIIQMLKLPDGTVKVLVEGKRRVKILKQRAPREYICVDVQVMSETDSDDVDALMSQTREAFDAYVKLSKQVPPDLLASVQSISDASRLADTIAVQLSLSVEQKQSLLEISSVRRRLEKLCEMIQSEVDALRVEKRIRTRVKRQMERSQREFYLNEQMQAIQKELGDRDELKSDIQELDDQIAATPMSEEARGRLRKEVRKLKMMAPLSAEATVVRGYIDWVLTLPWFEKSEERLDLAQAEQVLDEDHYGLTKVKERILEHLAVHALSKKHGERPKGPILCFVGPPGVGKTSLGRSIARATKRRFVRLSLGGVRDEAEIRGHRRTYIGAMPGKIIQNLRKAGTNNPVFLLDEVDKMSMDFRGDPSAALLEVLDPEQNDTFNDHYLDLDYDLADVMFLTTANNLHAIPPPLQDRMEIIQLPGYTDDEKLQIARKFLLPKQLKAAGLTDCDITISDQALLKVIHHYTKEAGVRSLEREIASICRKIARKVIDATASEHRGYRIHAGSVVSYLGTPKFRHGTKDEVDHVGQANGLAVTAHGGDLLMTEVTVVPGKGKLVLTGKLGDVMQESAQAALSYVRSRAVSFGLEPHFYQRVDIHVHCPEGAIPKDGPSAGITIAAAMVSALLHLPLNRDVAMTGEITLRGNVLAIGGVKEKIIAAHRSGVGVVIIPLENEKDLRDVPGHILRSVAVRTVSHMDEVLRYSLRISEGDELFEMPTEIVDWRVAHESPSPSAH